MEGDYNGWTNKATWLVNLWLGEMHNGAEIIRECMQGAQSKLEADEALRERIHDLLIEENDLKDAFACDMLNYAINEVNWKELTDTYYSEYLKSLDDETTAREEYRCAQVKGTEFEQESPTEMFNRFMKGIK